MTAISEEKIPIENKKTQNSHTELFTKTLNGLMNYLG